MKLYTIQGLSHWHRSETVGYLTGGKSFDHVDPQLHTAYAWMQGQMSVRLANTSGDLPVWGWPWDTFFGFRPDARWGPVGEDMVVLGFEVPDELVLLSDFTAWHQVLNNDSVDSGGLPNSSELAQEEKVATWVRIFDLPDLRYVDPQDLQACVDRVPLSQVFMATPFRVVPIGSGASSW